MVNKMKLIIACLLIATGVTAQVKDSIKVVFIYGSRPSRGYEASEPRWFGGMRGGHTAIQSGEDKVLSFRSTKYPCHIFRKKKPKKFRSTWEYRTVKQAWQTFPPHRYNIDSLQRAEVIIPITSEQRHKLDSIAVAYVNNTPYDYAFLGTRCASATYDVLQEIGIVPAHKHGNWLRIFTVRALRKRLFKHANKQPGDGWVKRFYKGGGSRKWERDFVR